MSRSGRVLALCLGALGSACGGDDDPSGPSGPSALAKQAGDGQTAVVGQAVATAPSVKVTNTSNQGVSGVSVTFAVASGGGSVTGATTTTDANGIATVGSWTLGQTPGANTLTATAAGTGISGSPATFTATANAGAPRTLTKEAGDNQTANAGAAVATAPAVKVVDQFGNPISGQTVTFSVASGGGTITGATPTTGADGRAAVGSWTLGATAGANTLTATVAGAGITGNPATFTATGQVATFNPTANTSLGGTNNYASVNIPAGVTVTATSDLVINATGNITLAGTITGDCRAITVNATGTLTMTGTVRNVCPATAAGTGANLSLIGRAGYNLSGTGTVSTSGTFDLTNDPTLTDADFLRVGNNRDLTTAGARVVSGRQGNIVYQGGPVCIVNGRAFNAEPPDAKKGADGGATGQPGDNGSTWTLRCRGNMEMSNTSVTGENGGQGGEGRDENNPNGANATGGAGGNGGLLKVQSTLSMGLNGNNQFTSGRGGQGAQAIASGGPNATPTTAASATATGGKGGNAGLIEVSGKGGIIISGLLRMIVGDGALGGLALATGANGMDATATRIAQHGGPATATGGAGGTVPNKNLSSSGSVVGLGNVQVTGGNGGPGGGATSQAGNGGAGVFPIIQNKPGGNGGNFTANGGNGGNTGLRDANNAPVGMGGNGGNMSVKNGNGGVGYNGCVPATPPNITSGGKGGNGGNGAGNSGTAGTGAVNGQAGTITVGPGGNGANGGDGMGPGEKGNKGTSTIGANGARTDVPTIFSDGARGKECPGTHNKTATLAQPNDPQNHESILAQVGSRQVVITIGANGSISVSGLFANSSIVLTGTISATGAITMSGSGVIGTGGAARNVSVQFTGTSSATAISGSAVVTPQGFGPATYPVNIPY